MHETIIIDERFISNPEFMSLIESEKERRLALARGKHVIWHQNPTYHGGRATEPQQSQTKVVSRTTEIV